MNRIDLFDSEIASIKELLKHLASQFSHVEDETFLKDACIYAHELPRRVRVFINDFKSFDASPGLCIIGNYPIDEKKIGKTPTHWKWSVGKTPTLEEEMLLILFGSLLGDVLGWSTQQDGHIVHDVLPIKGHEYEQLGTSSEEPLTWHNEDAFHPYRCDYLGMFCLRNPTDVATLIGFVDTSELDPAHVKVLFEPRFTIRPDESHLEKNKSDLQSLSGDSAELLTAAYRRINEMNVNPERIAIFHGATSCPYVRIDPYFMNPLEGDHEGRAALDALVKLVDGRIQELVLRAGDCLFIDNYRLVHGRKPFHAKFDGYDRWLKRINVTRDLRKSRGARTTPTSHIIY